MGFKLGTAKQPYAVNGEIKSPLTFKTSEGSVPGTPVYRKNLDGDVLAEANKDGSIYIDESIKKGSKQEEEILQHEMKHVAMMKTGKLSYDDEWIKYDGIKYPRKNGKIQYHGKWINEGSKTFPWEQH
tara:strand:+ start:62 stop:445 length:384 start_codon:yes stop_codon:yes gene_type:complete